MRRSTLTLVQMALLGAISIVLVYFIHFPIFPSAPFLEYDPADITLFMGAFLYGPFAGLILTALVCVIQGMTVSAGAGIIGITMHFAATGGYVLAAGLLYRRKPSSKRMIISMCVGTAVMCVTMSLWNLLLTPIFMNVPRSVVAGMLLPTIIPFNLIKAGANSILAFALHKATSKFIR